MSIEDDYEELKKLFERGEFNEAAKRIISELGPHKIKLLREMFGVGSFSDMTPKEIEKQFDVRQDRIKLIEEKALRKLRGKDDDPGDDAPVTV